MCAPDYDRAATYFDLDNSDGILEMQVKEPPAPLKDLDPMHGGAPRNEADLLKLKLDLAACVDNDQDGSR